MCATRQVRKAEEAPFVVMFILGDRGRGYQLPHEPARGSAVRLDERCLLTGPIRIPQRAMHHVKRVPQLFLLGYTCLWVCDEQLNDRGRIYHPSISFSKPTCSCCDGLLPHTEFEAQFQLIVVHRLFDGAR